MTAFLHHIELWVADYAKAAAQLGWLLEQLGFVPDEPWGVPAQGCRWKFNDFYIVIESGSEVSAGSHQRLAPGLNHVAFRVDTPARVEELVAMAAPRGWRLMFADRHPHAGGADHYAAYLENDDGFEIELVAA
ncbi:MAG: glyoxalase [Acidobacteria bacterium]|nr:glyoxalase [Acidobacteriota bacterium]